VPLPRISAVIPCYNGAAFLQEALDSIASQTRSVEEVIVVDDGSSDASVEIAHHAGAIVIVLPRNSGPAAARNSGIAAARGELIAFLDADDCWAPMHCEAVATLLERHPECPIAFSRIRRFGDEDSVSPIYLDEDTPASVLWHMIAENIVPQSAAIVRRETLRAHGGYDETRRYSEDYELWLRLAQKYPFVYTQAVTANYRVHPNQATQNIDRMLRGLWDVKHEFWVNAVKHESPEFVQQLEAMLLAVWGRTLRDAWLERNEIRFRTTLLLHDKVPHSEAMYRRWHRRYRSAWRGWLALARMWERLPGTTKDLIRPALAASFALGSQEASLDRRARWWEESGG
jgi:glycosyltransferase involved in cell wall biosynthesis